MRILIYILAYIILTLKLYSEPIKIIPFDSKLEICSNQELILKWTGTADDYIVEAKTEFFPDYRLVNFYKIENNTLNWIPNDKELLNSNLTFRISDKNNPTNFDEISNIKVYQATEILDQSQSITVCKNDFVYLRIDAIGFGLTYQWYKDGDKIEGSNSNIFSINESDYSHSGTYTCKIFSSGTCDVVESQPISVYVATPTKFTTAPEEVFWEYNKPISMTATIHSNNDYELNNIKFKWFKDTTIMTVIPPKQYKLDTIKLELKESKKYIGVNSQDLVVTGLVWNDRATYYCVATGLCGSDTVSCVIGDDSRFEVMKISPDYYGCEGQDVVFKAKVITNVVGTFTYQWYKPGFKILDESEKYVGTKTSELTIKNTKYDNDYNNYYVLVTWVEKKVSKRSEHFILKLNMLPRISEQPRNTIIKDRTNKFFGQTYIDVVVLNFEGCMYTWYRNGKLARKKCHQSNYWIGIDSCPPYGSLAPPPPRPSIPEDVGWYKCKIENECGTTWSDSVYIAWDYYEVYSCSGRNINVEIKDLGAEYSYLWEFKGEIVQESDRIKNTETNKLSISNLQVQDHGYYTVWSIDKMTKAKTLYCKVFVEVITAPYIQKDFPYEIENEGDKIKQIFASVISNGPYLRFEIYLDGIKVWDSTKYRHIFYYNDFGFLFGGNSQYIKPGVYQYHFINDCGEAWSNKMNVINTNYKPGGIIIVSDDDNFPSDVFIMNENEFKVYPNPASDFITITIPENYNHTLQGVVEKEQEKVMIFNTLGIEVLTEFIHPMTSSHRMNIESLSAGVYFIKIGDKVEKFVKM